ncbi:hypothetical protein [Spirillospora sp. NPDC048823]|uniref:hypothetical protein n=1 Tax=unclassified Spirillospora TaxID=2642701 RepID=UPI00371BE051
MSDLERYPEAVENLPAAARLLTAGADRNEVVQVARAAAYEAVFGLLFRLTAEGRDVQAPEDTPGWSLMGTTSQDRLTGRPVQGLHEDLLTMDPSGHDGQDLFQ